MDLEKAQAIIEAMLFAAGREVKIKEIMNVLEIGSEDIDKIMQNMKLKYDSETSGIELINQPLLNEQKNLEVINKPISFVLKKITMNIYIQFLIIVQNLQYLMQL